MTGAIGNCGSSSTGPRAIAVPAPDSPAPDQDPASAYPRVHHGSGRPPVHGNSRRRAADHHLPPRLDQGPPRRPDTGGADLAASPASVRLAPRLPVHLAQRRRRPDSGSRVGRPQCRRPAPHLRRLITAAHSRFMTGRMIPTRKTEDLLLGSWELIQQLGRVPRRLIWDNEPASAVGNAAPRAWLRSWARWPRSWCCCRRGTRSPRASWSVATACSRPRSCPVGSLLHRPTSTPSSPTGWARRNARVVRTIKADPPISIPADRAGMLPLPPVPLHLGWRNRIRLGRDYYVRLDTSDYSVDPTVIGRMVDVAADLDRVRVRRRAARRGAPPGLGARDDDHRPRARRDRRGGCAQAFQTTPQTPLVARAIWTGTSPTTTARSAGRREVS